MMLIPVFLEFAGPLVVVLDVLVFVVLVVQLVLDYQQLAVVLKAPVEMCWHMALCRSHFLVLVLVVLGLME